MIPLATEYLKAAGVESPRLQAELLLAHLLGSSRIDLYLRFEEDLSPGILDSYRQFLRRRRDREPLQLILGETEFFSRPFFMEPGVFIPRPETEILCEEVLKRLPKGPRSVLEMGSGSGVISVTLAAEREDLEIWASDLSQEALQVSRKNAERHGLLERIHFEECRGLPAGEGEAVDLIVSNPPYIRLEESETLEPEVIDYEPRDALFGGEDGLEAYRYLADVAPDRLKQGGILAVEIGADQGEEVLNIFRSSLSGSAELLPDYAGRDRIVIIRV
ncbi:MAG: peptide chain release factor N(5)-glutamine methyltransferase [Candidatus Krumholzibacteria bacterium]|nr:peptide chain release factor N(5)-glutamine methyltransferase [Candidatus Krumholzibacteria bacterium]